MPYLWMFLIGLRAGFCGVPRRDVWGYYDDCGSYWWSSDYEE